MKGVAEYYNESEERGCAQIRRFFISEQEAKMQALRSLINYEPGFYRVKSGDYVKLIVNGQLMMSDTLMERYTNSEFVRNAHGDVMIAGLGIGLIIDNLREKVSNGIVKRIIVYEKYQDVIDLIGWRYSDLPLEIRCEDILQYKPQKGEKYDTLYFDIWPDISDDNLKDMAMLHQRWKFHKKKDGWMDSWMCKYLRNRKKKNRKTSWY